MFVLALLVALAALGPLLGADSRDGLDWTPNGFWLRRRHHPERSRSDDLDADGPAPERTSSDRMGPEHMGPDRTGPERTGPARSGVRVEASGCLAA